MRKENLDHERPTTSTSTGKVDLSHGETTKCEHGGNVVFIKANRT